VARISRTGLVHASFILFGIALVGKAAKVQLFETSMWRDKARQQQVAASPLPAPRGMILDASGAMLVESRQLVKLAVRPKDVLGDKKPPKKGATVAVVPRNTDGVRRLQNLGRALARLGVSQEFVQRAMDTSRKWVDLPGTYVASDIATITATRGVSSTPVLARVPPATDGLRRLIGRADELGEPIDGLEKALDPILRGTRGNSSVMKDGRGGKFDSPGMRGNVAQPGNTVVLTINQSLQDIAEHSLAEAVQNMGATGGDIVMLDPQSGEVRAMASRRANVLSAGATALLEPYEPGSTLKPFTAARLLDLKRARTDEIMNTYGGIWNYNGRRIEDDHKGAQFSLADVIRFSSNIGIIQFAQRLQPGEQYTMLRDLGFGSATGVPYPSEGTGTLPIPQKWDKLTPASLAMGYALNVTPLQLAVAYGAIANGGELLEPSLVKEIRLPDGTVKYRHTRRVVRRVMSEASARTVRGLLRGVVESGTGDQASLATFDVAGKTGTAKRTEHGRYVAGKYTASFVGLFPAENPQFVILVKLDNPSKTIFGGKAAAPVSKTVLQAAIAARDAALDRRDLAAAPRKASVATIETPDSSSRADSLVRITASGSVPFVYRLDAPMPTPAPVVMARAVPDVKGMPVRRAVYALHRAGFRVSLANAGQAGGDAANTMPAAGEMSSAGSTVRLFRAP
jgi:cell division protein FtsI (penicillin-binding protein 3)